MKNRIVRIDYRFGLGLYRQRFETAGYPDDWFVIDPGGAPISFDSERAARSYFEARARLAAPASPRS